MEKEIRTKREDREANIRKIQHNLIGDRYAGATLSSIYIGTKKEGENGDESSQKIIEWITNNKNFLVYLGTAGIGKTYFCSAMIPWIHDKVRNYRYWKERDFFSKIRAAMTNEKGDWQDSMHYLLDYEFFMYDDLGSIGINEWRAEIIFNMIDMRYESRLPTIFTSNLTKEELMTSLGKRISSRLFAKENLVIENHDGQDLRQVIFQ